jgi:phenylpyruvate tautomerase PptA (4-oxalocrotonate tautomerase family)
MPIVTVEIVADGDDVSGGNLAQSLADAIGRALRSPPGQTWVRVRSLAHGAYAENEAMIDRSQMPVFVTVLERQPPIAAELEPEITALTHAIAQVVRRPTACVHIEYAPAGAGRVSFGGKLVQ